MKTFKVYKHPAGAPEAVKVGFSWPGFLLGSVWMLTKKMWGMALLWFGVYLVLETVTSVSEAINPSALTYLLLAVAFLALSLIPGFMGNQWREANLLKRGYQLVGTAQTTTGEAAVAQVLKPA